MIGAPTQLPNATPRPGELGLEVIQVGYMRGLLLRGRSGTSLDISFTEDESISGTRNLPGLRHIEDSLLSYVVQHSRAEYIERFIAAMEEGKLNPKLKPLYDALCNFEKCQNLPHPIGVGLFAVQSYGSYKQRMVCESVRGCL